MKLVVHDWGQDGHKWLLSHTNTKVTVDMICEVIDPYGSYTETTGKFKGKWEEL